MNFNGFFLKNSVRLRLLKHWVSEYLLIFSHNGIHVRDPRGKRRIFDERASIEELFIQNHKVNSSNYGLHWAQDDMYKTKQKVYKGN